MLSKFFVLLLAFSFIVGQLIRLDIFGVQFPLLDAAVFLYVAYHILTKRFSWKKYLAQKWLLAFIGALIVSNIINFSQYSFLENIRGNLYLVRFVIYSLIIGLQIDGQTWKSVSINKLIYAIGLIITFIGIFQFMFYPSFEYLKYLGWDEHLNRLAFPYLDPSFTGAILLIFVLINLFRRTGSPWRIVTVMIEIIAIILTFSRAIWVTGGIILFMLVWKMKEIKTIKIIKIIGGMLFISAIVFILIGKSTSYGNQLLRTETFLSRLGSSQKAVEVWRKNPILGVGFNNYKSYLIKSVTDQKLIEKYQESHGLTSTENSYLFIMATGGLIALIFFLIWLKSLFCVKDKLNFYVLTSIIIGSLFNNIFFYPFILLIIFVIASTQPKQLT